MKQVKTTNKRKIGTRKLMLWFLEGVAAKIFLLLALVVVLMCCIVQLGEDESILVASIILFLVIILIADIFTTVIIVELGYRNLHLMKMPDKYRKLLKRYMAIVNENELLKLTIRYLEGDTDPENEQGSANDQEPETANDTETEQTS